ncbi:MAG: lipocalin family protein [Stenotrophobium sp.]
MKAALLCLPTLAGCAAQVPNLNPRAAQPQQPAAHVDLTRYMGRWYIIASAHNKMERGMVGSYFEYSRREDGKISVVYSARKHDFDHPLETDAGVAMVDDTDNNARWSVQFTWPLSENLLILYVDPDYRYAVVGDPQKDDAWILSRQIYIGDRDYQHLLDVLDTQGYDTFRLIRVPQRPEFLGVPGYG